MSSQMSFRAGPSSSKQFVPAAPYSSQKPQFIPFHEKREWDRNQEGKKAKRSKKYESPCTEFMNKIAKKEKKYYDSDETIVSGDELAKLEITPKRDQPQVKI